MLKVKKVSKTYRNASSPVTALSNIRLNVEQGKFVSIIGKSGSGKSTLLSILGALDKPDTGDIEVDGQNVAHLSSEKLTKYRRGKIGFVFQSYNLVPNLTAVQNVCLPMEFSHVSRNMRVARAKELLTQVGLSVEKQNRRPSRLSGGEQQRVAIARALANKPTVILADEPTGNLDSATGKMIFDLLHELSRKSKTTIIVVTHDLAIAGKTDQTYRLADGKLTNK